MDADITSLDFLPEFLDTPQFRVGDPGVAAHIATLNRSLDDLPSTAGEFDMVWSEGVVYRMGL